MAFLDGTEDTDRIDKLNKLRGGSVTVLDANRNILTPDTHTGVMGSAHPEVQAPEKVSDDPKRHEHIQTAKALKDTATHTHVSQSKLGTGNPHVWIGTDPKVQKLWDELDGKRYLQSAVVTRGTICIQRY